MVRLPLQSQSADSHSATRKYEGIPTEHSDTHTQRAVKVLNDSPLTTRSFDSSCERNVWRQRQDSNVGQNKCNPESVSN